LFTEVADLSLSRRTSHRRSCRRYRFTSYDLLRHELPNLATGVGLDPEAVVFWRTGAPAALQRPLGDSGLGGEPGALLAGKRRLGSGGQPLQLRWREHCAVVLRRSYCAGGAVVGVSEDIAACAAP